MSAKVFVGNLSYRTSEAQLGRFFSEVGEIRSVTMPVDRESGRPRGFAFVEFASDEQAEMAVTVYDGRTLGGRPLSVRMAEDREARHRGRPRYRPLVVPDDDEDEVFERESETQQARAARRGRREWREMRRTKRAL